MSRTILDLTDAEILKITGEISLEDIHRVKAVLKEIKEMYMFGPHNGLTHAEHCWMWGPAHYGCAVAALGKALGYTK
jgi:hypothetical protein